VRETYASISSPGAARPAISKARPIRSSFMGHSAAPSRSSDHGAAAFRPPSWVTPTLPCRRR
jgi:hypothetical protein